MGLIYPFLLLLIFGYINCSRSMGVCSKEKSAVSNNGLIIFQEEFCCDNFERHEDGNCHACSVGFTSKAGNNCIPCLKDTFGFRCADNCQCVKSERCDNVLGCVLKHYSDNLSTENSFTMLNSSQSDLNNYQTTTFHITTDATPTRLKTELQSGIWTTSRSTQEDTNNSFIDQRVLTYMFIAVAGALVVIIGLYLCLICVCWKRHLSSKKKNTTAARSAFPLTKFPDIHENISDSQGASGYGYELIDESKLDREIPVIPQNFICVKSSNNDSDVCGTDSDGYLHPYNSLVSINSISDIGVDHENSVGVFEEKPYLELSTKMQCENEDQPKENGELINSGKANKKEDDVMYEVPKHTNQNSDKVVFF